MIAGDRINLLVSVRDEVEAIDAIAGGADWIDLKEPRAGSLGAVSAEGAKRVVQAIGGRCPISAALGELIDWPQSAAPELLEVSGISVVKLGLSGCAAIANWKSLWRNAFEQCLGADKHLAAVVYADWQNSHAPAPEDVLKSVIELDCRYLLVDTFLKRGAASMDILPKERLARIMHLACEAGMTTVLAGSLQASDFAQLVSLPIQMVAVRGAVCRGNRSLRIEQTLVHHLRERLTATQNRTNLQPTS